MHPIISRNYVSHYSHLIHHSDQFWHIIFIYESMRGYIHQTDRRLFTPDNGIMIEVQE